MAADSARAEGLNTTNNFLVGGPRRIGCCVGGRAPTDASCKTAGTRSVRIVLNVGSRHWRSNLPGTFGRRRAVRLFARRTWSIPDREFSYLRDAKAMGDHVMDDPVVTLAREIVDDLSERDPTKDELPKSLQITRVADSIRELFGRLREVTR